MIMCWFKLQHTVTNPYLSAYVARTTYKQEKHLKYNAEIGMNLELPAKIIMNNSNTLRFSSRSSCSSVAQEFSLWQLPQAGFVCGSVSRWTLSIAPYSGTSWASDFMSRLYLFYSVWCSEPYLFSNSFRFCNTATDSAEFVRLLFCDVWRLLFAELQQVYAVKRVCWIHFWMYKWDSG